MVQWVCYALVPCLPLSSLIPGLVYISAGVTDGVTVGHPCCFVLNCQEPLEKGRDRYCPLHRHLTEICAVDGCEGRTTRGFVTCVDPAHRAWEAKRRSRQTSGGASYTILSDRHNQASHSPLPTSIVSQVLSLKSCNCIRMILPTLVNTCSARNQSTLHSLIAPASIAFNKDLSA